MGFLENLAAGVPDGKTRQETYGFVVDDFTGNLHVSDQGLDRPAREIPQELAVGIWHEVDRLTGYSLDGMRNDRQKRVHAAAVW